MENEKILFAKNAEFHLSDIEGVCMPQRTHYPPFSSLGMPKKQDMILFVSDCETRYITKDNREIRTHDGDVVYVPRGSEYRVECTKNGEHGQTLQINFLLFDNRFEPFVFSRDILVFSPKNPRIRSLFEEQMLISLDISTTFAKRKAILYEILYRLSADENKGHFSSLILPALQYLNSHYEENPKITELARLCHISVEYFRRKFHEETGKTPTEYKNTLRLERATQYLLYTDMAISEIALSLSFQTTSHFIKSFRDQYGISPLQYRTKRRKNIV